MMTPSWITKPLVALTLVACAASIPVTQAAFAQKFKITRPWYVSVFAGASITNNYDTSIGFALNGASLVTNLSIDHKPGFHSGLVLGCRYNDKWRFEAQYSYFRTQTSKVTGSPVNVPPPPLVNPPPILTPITSGDSTLHMHLFMANAIYDFYHISDQIEPYLGAGLGLASIHSLAKANVSDNVDPNDPEVEFNPAVEVTSSLRDTQFAMQGLLGFRYNLADTDFVDFGYRFVTVSQPHFYRSRVQENRFTLTYSHQINP